MAAHGSITPDPSTLVGIMYEVHSPATMPRPHLEVCQCRVGGVRPNLRPTQISPGALRDVQFREGLKIRERSIR